MYAYANGNFYPFSLKKAYQDTNTWPENYLEVDEGIFAEFSGVPPAGKLRGTGGDGMPEWVDIPPMTQEELIDQNERKKQQLLAEATTIIDPLKDAMDGGYIDDADIPGLKAWQRYRYALTKVDPSNPEWPDVPSV
ncbi:tail fiber assembly protein [Citrobacter freundii]|nr:tail fiber assembly protein [Citrobacter freundii]